MNMKLVCIENIMLPDKTFRLKGQKLTKNNIQILGKLLIENLFKNRRIVLIKKLDDKEISGTFPEFIDYINPILESKI